MRVTVVTLASSRSNSSRDIEHQHFHNYSKMLPFAKHSSDAMSKKKYVVLRERFNAVIQPFFVLLCLLGHLQFFCAWLSYSPFV
jgi:hypothetical protein